MESLFNLLKIIAEASDGKKMYQENLQKYKNETSNWKLDFVKLRYYFKEFTKHKKYDQYLNQSYIEPIIQISNLDEALFTIYKKWISNNNARNNAIAIKDKNRVDWYQQVISFAQTIKSEIWNFIEKSLYDIEIKFIERPHKDIQSGYEKAIELYYQNQFESAFRQARDIFQKDLEKTFNKKINFFEKKNDDLSKSINVLLQSISDIRNKFAKTGSFAILPEKEQKAITKLSIEQLLNIRNYLCLIS